MDTSLYCCPLCNTPDAELYHTDRKRSYWKCSECDLVFVPSEFHLNSEQEKAVYDQHENNPDDPGYRKFLSRAWLPLREKLKPGEHGLDFGCGPGPTLSLMAEEDGYPCTIFDLYFANTPEVLRERHYDFITSTEVIEHIAEPHAVLSQLLGMLKSLGHLCLMTKRHHPDQDFGKWHYILDPTHITFYSEATFHWIAQHFNCSVEFPAQDVTILRKMT